MSKLKYKSSNSAATTSTQPIWCSLSTPSQIARKYASIAPIWCHISRPRQLKKKVRLHISTSPKSSHPTTFKRQLAQPSERSRRRRRRQRNHIEHKLHQRLRLASFLHPKKRLLSRHKKERRKTGHVFLNRLPINQFIFVQ